MDFQAIRAEVVAITPDGQGLVQSYLQENPIPFQCLPDPDREVFNLYGVPSRVFSLGQRPGAFVIDSDQTIRFRHVGAQQWNIPHSEKLLDICRAL